MLSATQLTCSRGERILFTGLNLSVSAGQWLQITGANGAGKTTLLRTLIGLSAADEGHICWHGKPIREQADEFRDALLYLGHAPAVKDDLTVLENLRMSGALDGHDIADSQANAALHRMGLRGRGHLPARWLSAGQKRRVLLARLLLRPSTLWVLDEPFAALDAAAIDLVGDLIENHLANGGMAVLTSHQPVPLADGAMIAL